MSSLDRTVDARRTLKGATLAVLLGLGATGLSGCGADIHPLYGALPGGSTKGTAVTETLRHVDVTGGGRVGQIVRNELVLAFYGGEGNPTKPIRYTLETNVTSIQNAVGIERYQNLASAYLEHLSATWVLTEIDTGKTLASGTSFAQAAYDYSQQRYADQRALRDAENRAAGVIASDIGNQITVYFTNRP